MSKAKDPSFAPFVDVERLVDNTVVGEGRISKAPANLSETNISRMLHGTQFSPARM